jgi:anaerobic ribonucleoside-triphosphate reductase activating protein
MNFSEIKYFDIANGEGVRTTLFVSGCRHACPGCFNPDQQDFTAGEPFTEQVQQQIVDSMAPAYVAGLTLLGGEPMEPENQRTLAPFIAHVREACPGKTIWCYTGDLLEDLCNPESPRHTEVTDDLLVNIDVLVDGPFVEAKHDITLRFRGSSNQRIIDMPATLSAGEVRLWVDDPQYTTHSMVE